MNQDIEKHHKAFTLIFRIFTIIWMTIIFAMSAQSADESTETSLFVGRTVCQVFVPGYREMPDVDQARLARKIDHPVRKVAHATEYAVLAILVWLALSTRRHSRYLIAILFSFMYASTDEFHQIFVPGRAGMFTDVMIDTAGAAVGLLLIFFCKNAHKK